MEARSGLEIWWWMRAANRPGASRFYTGKPVIAEDIENEKRFDVPDFLRDHGIKSLINVIIQGKGEAFGVLEVDSSNKGASTRRMSISCKATPTCWRRRSTAIRPTTRWRRLADERAILLRELQHRVKNNLQIITSLLNMQIRRVGSGEVESQLRIIGSRVETLRVVHDNLFQAENIEQIPLPAICIHCAKACWPSMASAPRK